MMTIATTVANNFVPYLRVLRDTLRQWHPEARLVVGLADGPAGESEGWEWVGLEEMGIPRLREFCFRYTRREMLPAVKPFLLRSLLGKGHETVLFLDADMMVLGPLDGLWEAAQRHALTLTPHLVGMGNPAAVEKNILQCGVYNGGCLGVRAGATAGACLSWWQERVTEHCRFATSRGMHFDQRWLDYAPSFVEGLGVVREPGYNVAYWNLAERGGRADWRLFHFSGFDGEAEVTRYWPEKRLEEMGEAAELYVAYGARLRAAGWAPGQDREWAFDRWEDGVLIEPSQRQRYGRLGRGARWCADPFRVEMREWLEEVGADADGAEVALWRRAAEERLTKLEEANDLLGRQQVELDELRNALAGERERAAWLEREAAMYEEAARERLRVIERLTEREG
jgi:hypothetical protein